MFRFIFIILVLLSVTSQYSDGSSLIHYKSYTSTNLDSLRKGTLNNLKLIGIDTVIEFWRSSDRGRSTVYIIWRQDENSFIQKFWTDYQNKSYDQLIQTTVTDIFTKLDSITLAKLTLSERLCTKVLDNDGNERAYFTDHDSRSWIFFRIQQNLIEYEIDDLAIQRFDWQGKLNLNYKMNIESEKYCFIRSLECYIRNSGYYSLEELDMLTIVMNKASCR